MVSFVNKKLLERLIYLLALSGMGLTLHIGLWYGSGGSGEGDPLCGVESNCIGVIASDPAPLGIPSAWWGFLLYLIIGIVTLVSSQNYYRGLAGRLITGRVILVGFGWIYSLFLTILQAVAIDGWCQLCLYSFSIVTLIAVFTFWGFFKKLHRSPLFSRSTRESIFHGAGFAALLAFLIWDYSNVSKNEESAFLGSSIGESVDPASCLYSPESPTFDNLDQIVTDYDLTSGSVDAPILVVEFFDPNCHHCKAVHPNLNALAEAYPDSIRIVYKPVPVVGGPTHSLDEIAALYFANEEGKLKEMMDLVFEYQSPATGLSIDRLTELAGDLGMNERDFRRALSGREYASRTTQTTRIFQGMGFNGVPVIIINGRRISSASRQVGCLKHFVEEAKLQL